MQQSLTLLSPAKLNLFLLITGRRADGYHNLQTLFQLLNFGDELTFSLRNDNKITLSPELPGVKFEENLITKAAKQLIPFAQTTAGIDIYLTKKLPMGGGIGGGSSNAATTLVALNHLWQCNLNRQQLLDIGLTLGADVPVFINGKTAWAEGVGESLTPIEMPTKWFLVLQPDCHVSTKEIFSHKDLTRDSSAIKVAAFLESSSKNDCQALVRKLYPEVDKALNWFENHQLPAKMTGTGACVFSQFSTANEAHTALHSLPKDLLGFVAQGINNSPLLNLVPKS